MADEQLIEQVADQIEEVAEVTRRLTSRELGFLFAGTGIGVAIGFSVGYFALNKRVEKKYDEVTSAEIEKMREHYNRHYAEMQKVMKGPKPPIEKVMRDLGYQAAAEVSDEAQGKFTAEELEAIEEANRNHPGEEEDEIDDETEAVIVVPESQVTSSVFIDTPGEPWNYAKEVKSRTRQVPYVIHLDEFRQNEPEHEQVTYTYYEQDDILADSHDMTIDDMDKVIGIANLERWGHGSQDVNIVYIRNEVLSLDLEIVRDRGSYAEQTSGSIRHSSDRRRRPQRGFDDD
jgi:gas vesicle protein